MSDNFKIPEYCPICSSPLVIKGQFLYCYNKMCPAKLSGSVKVWVKRLGLLHWGDSLIDSLTDPDNPKINSLADLYELEPEEIATCTSGMKMAKKCWDILHANKSIKLELLIASLNVPNLAISTATDIVQAGYDSVDKILSLTIDQLESVKNIGHVTAQQIFLGLQERKQTIIDLAYVLDIKGPCTGALSGISVCITGTTSKPRKAVQKLILDSGGIVKDSVGSGLTYLVTNEVDTTSNKMIKAKRYGIKIISELQLYEIIGLNNE